MNIIHSNHGKFLARQVVMKAMKVNKLPKGSVVHHIDGNQKEFTSNNLVLCEDTSYHFLLHRRTEALEACGNPTWRRCWICKEYDAPENLNIYTNDRHVEHTKCRTQYARLTNPTQGRRIT